MKFTECPEFKLKIEFLDGHTEIYIHCIDYYLNDISGIYHITYWDGWRYAYTQINRELIKKISTTEKHPKKNSEIEKDKMQKETQKGEER